ncbi:MAG: bifunctional serine/threonine-protein kinase/ABC transporter substrate-binding protein [Prochloraceae cyanobacterium]|nr:bifunctional serine/threonine-protein kinase/ABC transporter substrate-binding protein [Prochloraceae cyanobacterium]
MCLNPGDILVGRYEIVSKYKKGGFSQTYKARDIKISSNPLCIVKEIKSPKSKNQQLLDDIQKRFIREAQTLERLGNHSQIPQLFDYFKENGKFYLVQEYIEGHDLRQELTPDKKFNEKQVVQLLQDILEIIKFVHDCGVIHRDIKPSNLIRRKKDGKIVLIDFGAVKQISTVSKDGLGETTKTRVIGTENYMPPETQAGKPKPSSDIYAVGIMGIQAITGLHPRNFPTDPRSGELIWRFATHDRLMLQVSSELESILNKMVRYHFKERYHSVDEVLLDLSQKDPSVSKQPPSVVNRVFSPSNLLGIPFKSIFWFGLGLVSSILSVAIVAALFLAPKTCDRNLGDELSCGEEILSIGDKSPEKEEGVTAFAKGQYSEAIAWLEQARLRQPNDPEVLIYLNNARLATQNLNVYTIAVAVPLGEQDDAGDIGREVLRGVAQFQKQFNEQNHDAGFGLRIAIAHDDSSPLESRDIANKLVERPGILAVIGHFSSSNTLAALPIYEDNNLVLISPTSTADQLSKEHTFFFRTVPNNSFYAKTLADYLLNETKNDKVAVFYNPNSTYSKSLHDLFFHIFYEKGGQVEKQVDLSRETFAPEAAIVRAQATDATALVLFPDADVDSDAFDNTLKLITTRQNRMLMVGGDILYRTELLEEGEWAADKMVIPIPWHYLNSPSEEFVITAEKLWSEHPSWRAAMGYDSTSTLAKAIEQQPQLNFIQWLQSWVDPKVKRLQIQQILKNSDFVINGVSGKITFKASGDRQEPIVELVKVVRNNCSPYGYSFIPIKYADSKEAGFFCE